MQKLSIIVWFNELSINKHFKLFFLQRMFETTPKNCYSLNVKKNCTDLISHPIYPFPKKKTKQSKQTQCDG